MIHEQEIIPLFLDATPSFWLVWTEHRAYWDSEEAGRYIDIAECARHLVDLAREGRTKRFPLVFARVERLIVDGDHAVQGLAIVGLLEGVQNVSLNTNVDPNGFRPWFGPQSRAAWDDLNALWQGKSTLMDVGRGRPA